MVDKVNRRVSDRSVTEEQLLDAMNREFVPILRKTVAALNALLERHLEGEGSPEGVVTANKGAIYQSTDGTGQLYRKTTDDSSTGWVVLP